MEREVLILKGSSKEIGEQYGRVHADKIRNNVDVLIHRVGIEILKGENDIPMDDPDFIKWENEQERILKEIAPYLLEEIDGIAKGAGLTFREILLLNLRAWQYRLYAKSFSGCSSLAVTLNDGTVANAGALDDPYEIYCGPVHYIPDKGYRSLSFPIAGTVWGNRGMNSEGLSIGISSQVLLGLHSSPNVINQDIALRIILQNCITVEDVREFCRRYAFAINLICVDKESNIFCAHQTFGGIFEYQASEGYAALTNHIIDDALIFNLSERGVRRFIESETTRLRRGNLLDFAKRRNGKCTGEEVRDFIQDRRDGLPSAICNKSTIVLTYANPQVCRDTLWINYLGENKNKRGFTSIKL